MKVDKKLLLIAVFLVFICIATISNANSIESIDLEINILETGDALVTERWKCYTEKDEGTEVYHPYYNLGNSKIIDFYVVDETGSIYSNIGAWSTKKSFNDKANKCGINLISDGLELCWGVSSYGEKTYTVHYTITNFVSNLTDKQMIYWTLIPYEFSTEIQNCSIVIQKDNYQLPKTTDVYGYGNYGGACYVADGKIFMSSNGPLDSNEYMTILAFLPKDFAQFAQNDLDYDAKYYLDMANEGAEKYKKKDRAEIISAIIGMITFFGAMIGIVVAAAYYGDENRVIRFGKEGKKLPKKSNLPYYRDIPLNGDIFKIYFVALQYGIIKNTNDLIGAFILKWLKDEKIGINTVEKGRKLLTNIDMRNPLDSATDYENQLYRMLKEASIDGILENKEFEKWCRTSYKEVISWFKRILKEERTKMVDLGYVTQEGKKYISTPELKEEAIKIAGLKKFLEEYSMIKDREPLQVHLLEEYLIIAQILGIANKVAKDFKNLYPNLIEESHYQSYNSIIYIHDTSYKGTANAKSAQAAYNSGGGGFSSGGGGGGSFGGGGGRRRIPLKFKNGIDKQTNVC